MPFKDRTRKWLGTIFVASFPSLRKDTDYREPKRINEAKGQHKRCGLGGRGRQNCPTLGHVQLEVSVRHLGGNG